MERFNPSRLDLARRRRGLTKKDLADALGVSPRMLNQYERGDSVPSEPTIEKLVTCLRFPREFYVGDTVEEPSIEGVSFRSLSAMTRRQRDQAIGSAAVAVLLDDWITDRFDLPAPNVPRYDSTSADPELAAAGVRQAWGLGERRVPNIVHLLEKHGVRVFSLVQECVEVDAFSFWRRGRPYIFLNSIKTPERSRMDAAHELAHLVMHTHGGPDGRRAEEEAQGFGAAFLMPQRSVLASAPRGGNVRQIIAAKRQWGVSAMNLTHRMHKLKLLTDWQARSAYIQLGQLGYRDGEPVGIPRETSQLLHKVFSALREEGVARRTIARELGLPLDEINRAAFGLAVAQGGAETSPPPPERAGRPDLHVIA
jgi:Zn-dependent peptidase ImmA (M78 family)/transcriptional regulator with XRE-family HTH domain